MRIIDLLGLAVRLEAEEKFKLRYRWPVGKDDLGVTQYVERVDPLLDVAEETGVFFVSQYGEPVKVWLDEAIEVIDNGL